MVKLIHMVMSENMYLGGLSIPPITVSIILWTSNLCLWRGSRTEKSL